MDDPISALDANVKKKIFKLVFMRALSNKTRVLVTHAVDFLHFADSIILLKGGSIVFKGPYEQVKSNVIEFTQNIKSLIRRDTLLDSGNTSGFAPSSKKVLRQTWA